MCVVFIGLAGTVRAAYVSDEDAITVQQAVDDDAFLAGRSIAISAPIRGELFSVGSTVSVAESVSRSVFAAGNTVTIDKGAGYNIFAAGSTVTIKGTVEHDVYVAGQTVIIDPSAHIKGTLRAAGETVTVAGRIEGDAYFETAKLTSNATIGGDLRATTDTLAFTGGAIAGDLVYTANATAQGLDKVTVRGATHYDEQKRKANPGEETWLWAILTAIVSGAALLLLVPKKVQAVTEHVESQWLRSFLTGLVLLIVVPIASLILLVTFVGAPIAIITLVLYFCGLYIAAVLGHIALGYWLLKLSRAKQLNWWVALLVGAVALTLLKAIPGLGTVIGMLFFFGLTLPFFGSLLTWWREILRPYQKGA